MKRHMDLIRAILNFAEEQGDPWFAKEIDIEGWVKKDIVYNVGLAVDEGLLDGTDESMLGPDGRDFLIQGLTYYGHEFLDKVRSDTVWNQLKKITKKQAIELTVDFAIRHAPDVIAGLVRIPSAL